jgi:hypothetical protein
MIEYTVVCAFALITLTTVPIPSDVCRDPVGVARSAVGCLTGVLRDNYEAYAYTVSLSEYPDVGEWDEVIRQCEASGRDCTPLYEAEKQYLLYKDADALAVLNDFKAKLAAGLNPGQVTPPPGLGGFVSNPCTLLGNLPGC